MKMKTGTQSEATLDVTRALETMRLRRPMTGAPYEFDIDHPGTASGYPVWALNHAGTALSADWPTGRGRESGDLRYSCQIADHD
ncbi:hypothetical protein N7481_011403 [Penicillium waksmanii]|uniref:uncharacterized protein n=1 Tax=Penicillium waksmanii TaxID=69791 RepID=UPI0025495701|nr:uncharacterized protein N7481_011403 [Penicillium waksmanii]KAJ5974193.1 hypothetical protein N7481_011403 [Penicillium waksmanii]